MTLTVGEFFNLFEDIVKKSGLNSLEQEQIEILDKVNEILVYHITEQCTLDELPDDEYEHEEKLKKILIGSNVISDMCITLNDEIQYEDAIENFLPLLEMGGEMDLFLKIIDVYENFGLEEAINQVKKRNLINIIPKKSYLYSIIEGLYRGEDITTTMVLELKNLGIDLKTNPVIKKSEEVKNFLFRVESFLFGLLTNGNDINTKDTLNSVN